MAMADRLARLEAIYRRPAPAGPTTFDPARLTVSERDELGRILARCRPGEGPYARSDPGGLWALTDGELARATLLVHVAHGSPLPPGWGRAWNEEALT